MPAAGTTTPLPPRVALTPHASLPANYPIKYVADSGPKTLTVPSTQPVTVDTDDADILLSTRFMLAGTPTPVFTYGAARYRDYVLSTLPDMYWPLNDTDLAKDLAGGNKPGTGQFGATIGGSNTSPIVDESFSTDLDGADDSVSGSFAPFAAGSAFTVMCWANRDASANADALWSSTGNATYLQLNSGSTTVQFDPNAAAGAAGITWASAWPGNGVWAQSVFSFDDSTNAATLAINGAVISTQSHTDALVGGTFRCGVGNFGLNPFDGKQAHVAVWNRILTETEIRYLYLVATSTSYGLT